MAKDSFKDKTAEDISEDTTAKVDTGKSKEPSPAVDTIFELRKLRLSQSFSEIVGVKKILVTVPVRRPNPQEFVRVKPGEDWFLETAVLELKIEREIYLVNREIWQELAHEIIPKVLFTTINRQGVLTLWPIRLPGKDGRHDAWNRSALDAAQLAKEHWVRVSANSSLGAYDVVAAPADLPDPEWPNITFQEVVRIAFRDRIIQGLDHPVVRRLRGEM